MQYKSVDYTLTPEEQGLKVGDWIKVSGGCEFDEDTGNIAVRLTTVPPPVQHAQTNLVRIEGIGYQYPNLEAGSTIIVTGRISEIPPPFEYSEGDYLPQYYISFRLRGLHRHCFFPLALFPFGLPFPAALRCASAFA